jgi:hypothetical protein
VRLHQKGDGPEEVKLVLHQFVAQLVILSNFELHLRKVFWVADDLSWSFSASSLDGIDGAALRLPFGCLALVFTDRYALGLAERLLARIPNVVLRGRILRVLTVYLHNVAKPGGRRGIRIAFTCDAGGDDWPARSSNRGAGVRSAGFARHPLGRFCGERKTPPGPLRDWARPRRSRGERGSSLTHSLD